MPRRPSEWNPDDPANGRNHCAGLAWRSRDPKVWRRFKERRGWRGRWGLRRRLTFFFAFVALAAVFITTWFTLGAVFSAFFPNQPDGPFRWWQDTPGRYWSDGNTPLSDSQFRAAREALGHITGTAFWAGTLAFLLAVVAAAVVTRILTRPLVALTDGAKRLEAGERGIRIKVPRSRDELRSLTEAFNNLVTGLERQEAWRRNLVADIAHDLRTPLAVLRSEIEAMQDGVSRPDEAGLERLHGQVLLLTQLVNDLRTLSLAESGGMGVKKEQMELAGYLEEVLEMFRSRAVEAGLELVSSVPPQLFAPLDPNQMKRVLNNLLDNAVRYASPGKVEVSALVNQDRVQIEVRDFGPGLSQEALERVFDRFYRGDASRTRAEGRGGSGLGLTIARAIVEAHGGKLAAANHPQGGAVFTIYLSTTAITPVL